MRRRHLRSVLAIEREVYPRPWSRGLFLADLATRATRGYWVAIEADGVGTEASRQVIGYAGLMMAGEEGHVTTLAVDPPFQHRRVATRLLLQLTVDALRRGALGMTLEVRESNVRARRLYERFGYLPVGRRRNYYPETKEDAVIMTARDVASRVYMSRLHGIAATVPGRTIVTEQTTRVPG